MKKLRILGAVGILSLTMGMPVFAADFAGGHTGPQTGRGIGCYMNPAVCMTANCVKPFYGMTAVRCNVGSHNSICQNWSEYCSSYVDADNNGVCDNYTGAGNGNYVDADNNGVCDNYTGAGNGGHHGGGSAGAGNGGGHHRGRNR